jgi:hypothetical protein
MSKVEVNAVEPQCGTTLTLGASGDTVTIPSGATISNLGTAAGFGSTGEVSWDTTKKTTGFTATSGVGYFCDTTSAAFTVTLPATPSAGNVVAISDYNGTAATNNITVGRNSSNINGAAEDFIIAKSNSSIQFIYVDATVGWQTVFSGNTADVENNFIVATGGTITCCGDFKIHTFTGPGTFTVTNAGTPAGSITVDYLVVGGGGSGGPDEQSGGGGAGGYRESSGAASGCYTASPLGACVSALPVTVTGYPISVGGGGAATYPNPTPGNPGSNSVFSTITSAGGGSGGRGSSNTGGPHCASAGGSGGGGGSNCGTGGSGNTPPVSPPQGQNGGTGGPSADSGPYGGGGGGAGAAGTSGNNQTAPGGIGVGTAIAPTQGTPGPTPGIKYFAGGGGGGGYATPGIRAPGGAGGGGAGGAGCGGSPYRGISGTANTGGGGGGAYSGSLPDGYGSGDGGSGIVIIRYKYQ